MTDIAYERPNRVAPAPEARDIGYENPHAPVVEPQRDKTVGDYAREGALATGTGAAAGAAFWALRGLLRKGFPGAPFPGFPTTSALKKIDSAIRSADSASSLKNEFREYMRMVSRSEQPITFADFLAQRPGMKNAVSTVKEMMGHSGNVPFLENMLGDRVGDAQRQRILKSISEGMGVDQKGISESIDEIMKNRSKAAEPLYAEAFKNKNPVQDSRLLDLFGRGTPNMAMMNALKARLKTLALKGEEAPSLYAASPERKDAWKRLLTSDVPDQLFTGQDWNKLRSYYAPSIEDLHWMRKNLWDAKTAAKKSGDSEAASAYGDAWRKLTDYLDTSTSGAYKKARQQYKGDSDMLDAFEFGSELLKKKPDEVRTAVRKMGPAERDALAAGFYGGLEDMNSMRFIREFVARPERYPERQELLSTVFRDPTKLRNFLDSLQGEQAVQAAAHSYGDLPLPKDATPRMPYARLSDSVSLANPKASLIERLDNVLGWPSQRASRAGTDVLFREPYRIYDPGGGENWTHQDWNRVGDTALSPLERALQAGRFTGAGAVGGLGIYGASQIPTGGRPPEPAWLGQPAP